MTSVAVIGAGPYGLSIAAYLHDYGVNTSVFGIPLDTWRSHMPAGMLLKSDGFASNVYGPKAVGTLADYCRERGIPYHDTDIPVPLEVFGDYAVDFQRRFVPGLEEVLVAGLAREGKGFRLKLTDGQDVRADRVVCGFHGGVSLAIDGRDGPSRPSCCVSCTSSRISVIEITGRKRMNRNMSARNKPMVP